LAAVPEVTVPDELPGHFNCAWMTSMLLDPANAGEARRGIIDFLQKRKIEARPFFQPIHLQKPYAAWRRDLPVAEQLYQQGINLPSNINMSVAEVAKVTAVIQEWTKT